MTDRDPALAALFVESFNADLAVINSAARVALPQNDQHGDYLELRDDEGNLLEFIPAATEPEMAAIPIGSTAGRSTSAFALARMPHGPTFGI